MCKTLCCLLVKQVISKIIDSNSTYQERMKYSGKTIINELFILQKKIVRNVMGVKRRVHTNSIFSRLGLLKLSDLIEYNTRVVGWKIWYGKAPKNLIEGYEKTSLARNTRSSNDQNFKVPFCKKEKLKVASCYRKVGLFRKCRVNMQHPISAKRNAWEENFTSIGNLNL